MSTQLARSDASLVIKSSQNAINKQPKFVAKFALNQEQILEAQGLRAKTFGQEYGVSFSDHPQGLIMPVCTIDVFQKSCSLFGMTHCTDPFNISAK